MLQEIPSEQKLAKPAKEKKERCGKQSKIFHDTVRFLDYSINNNKKTVTLDDAADYFCQTLGYSGEVLIKDDGKKCDDKNRKNLKKDISLEMCVLRGMGAVDRKRGDGSKYTPCGQFNNLAKKNETQIVKLRETWEDFVLPNGNTNPCDHTSGDKVVKVQIGRRLKQPQIKEFVRLIGLDPEQMLADVHDRWEKETRQVAGFFVVCTGIKHAMLRPLSTGPVFTMGRV